MLDNGMVSKKIFKCDTCTKAFSQKSNLARHAAVHQKSHHLKTKAMKKNKSQTRDHKCDVCFKAFPSNFKLVRHSYTHLAVKPFPCDLCEKRFSRKDHLQVHYRRHTGEKTCYCLECGQGFNSSTSLQRHMMRLHSEGRKTIPCPECLLEFPFKSQLKKHFDTAHRECYTCQYCGNISSSDGALYRHLKKHIITQPYSCIICMASFFAPEEMRQHECCPTDEEPCKTVVRVALIDIEGLDDHIDPDDQREALSLERKFDQRGRRPKQKSVLMNADDNDYYLGHNLVDVDDLSDGENQSLSEFRDKTDAMITEMTLDESRSLFCKYCDKQFVTVATKLAHELSHLDGGEKLRCSLCNGKFSDSSKLARHLRLHTGEMPYTCEFCDKAFPRNDYLKRHIDNNHSTNKEKVCSLCFQIFKSTQELNEHLKKHKETEVKVNRHFCDFCGTSFPMDSELQQHIQSNHSSGYYKCKYCPTMFTHMSSRSRHEISCKENTPTASSPNGILTIDELSDNDNKNEKFIPPGEEEVSICLKCNLVFETPSELDVHNMTLHYSAQFKCDLCPSRFTNENSLKKHIEVTHFDESLLQDKDENVAEISARKYSCIRKAKSIHHCKECDTTYESLHDFLLHVREHSASMNEDGFLNCVMCEDNFKSVEELSNHLQNHEDNMIVEVGVHDDKDSDAK